MFLRTTLFDQEKYEGILKQFRQIFPVLCGCLIPVSFGMMLGWPSLAYPYLLDWSISPIPISLDQTSLIAGFLMEGNSIGTLFSTSKLLSSKVAIFFCCCLQFFGWGVMFGANDIFGLLVSRASVGFANGYGTGQLKRYIKETCPPELAQSLMHYIPVGINIGIILIYSTGAFVTYRMMAIFSMIIPLLSALLFGLIPKKTLTRKRASTTKNVLQDTLTLDISKIEECLNNPKADECEEKQASLFECLRDARCRNGLGLIFLIVFMQQYTGGPANIVYSQIIFTQTGNPYPKICSIIYAVFFMVATILSLKFVRNFPRKANLLVSSAMCFFIISLMSLYFHLKHDLISMTEYFSYLPLFILFIFNAFHTFGLATIPFYIILEKMPKRGRNIANKFLVINFSMGAVISTKIFQVLFGIFDMTIAYAFFAAVALGGFILLIIFMDEYDVKEEKRKSDEKPVATVDTIEFITHL